MAHELRDELDEMGRNTVQIRLLRCEAHISKAIGWPHRTVIGAEILARLHVPADAAKTRYVGSVENHAFRQILTRCIDGVAKAPYVFVGIGRFDEELEWSSNSVNIQCDTRKMLMADTCTDHDGSRRETYYTYTWTSSNWYGKMAEGTTPATEGTSREMIHAAVVERRKNDERDMALTLTRP